MLAFAEKHPKTYEDIKAVLEKQKIILMDKFL
jgi:hypothetical protein